MDHSIKRLPKRIREAAEAERLKAVKEGARDIVSLLRRKAEGHINPSNIGFRHVGKNLRIQ